MPIYEYQAQTVCALCPGTFEVFAKMDDADLSHCPRCGIAVQRVLSATPSQLGQAHLLAEKNFSQKGFSQYRKADGGVYQKTAGSGPEFVTRDGKPVESKS